MSCEKAAMSSKLWMLGVSLWCYTKGTNNEPRKLGLKHVKDIHEAIVHPEGTPLHFLREAEASEVPKRRL
jgi:hypothetical protein